MGDVLPHPGAVVAGRFRLDRWAGAGGMGTVWQAFDLEARAPVALKVIARVDRDADARFAREARILASLDHPAIVRFVAHGELPEGGRYLAMEWLDGEDLSARLARGRLDPGEVVQLATRLADGLAAVHTRGVVHRDLKPANVFLEGGDLARAKLLDFGLGQVAGTNALTGVGAVVGTPGYMAPEQACGEAAGAATDVFALGCVLYECLAGRPAFRGETMMAVLAKVLLDAPPRLRETRLDVPHALEALLMRMLVKQPGDRLADGAAVAAALASVPANASATPETPRPVALGRGEQRIVSVIAASPPHTDEGDTAPTLVAGHDDELAAIEAAARAHGCAVVRLADGSVLASLVRSGEALEQAARAARAALAMRRAATTPAIAVATGRARVAETLPVGEVIDRVATALRRPAVIGGAIGLDELTAGLCELAFDLVREPDGAVLIGERDPGGGARLLCGRPTRCVGRDRELAMLDGIWHECVAEPVARAVLITAPPGYGKSRLRYELARRRAREAATVLIGRADAVSAGSPFGLCARALARAAGLRDGDPIEAQRARLLAHVERVVVDAADSRRIAAFLGVLIEIPTADDGIELRTARGNAVLMGDQIKRAWVDYLAAECAAAPVLLVLEDLHWGDLPSVHLVDTALRELREQPLMVMALARPEVRQRFPDLFAERDVQEVRLTPLSRRAALALITDVLPDAAPETVASLVERAGGIAFFLEELIRAVHEGHAGEPPPTAVAMAHARVDALAQGARRVLRAASVLGEVFWAGAAAALVGADDADARAELDRCLAELARAELITPRAESRIAGDVELVFRHALVREAAYAALTDADRTLGHRLAADWLEAAGLRDALLLAEHRSRGADLAGAIPWYLRAAEQALEGNDYVSALERVERARKAGADGEARGRLELIAADAHKWRGEWAAQAVAGLAAMANLAPGSPAWCQAVTAASFGAGRTGDRVVLSGLIEALRDAPVIASAARIGALIGVASDAQYCGVDAGAAVFAQAFAEGTPLAASDPFVAATLHRGRAFVAFFEGDTAVRLDEATAAAAAYQAAGALRLACGERLNLGTALADLGAFDEAAAALAAVRDEAERAGLASIVNYARTSLGVVLTAQGRLAEAAVPLARALAQFVAEGNQRNETGARDALAALHLVAGDLAAAEREARHAASIAAAPPLTAHARATLARVLVAAGRAADALAVLDSGPPSADLYWLAAQVEVLAAAGRRDDARAAAIRATAELDAIAARIGDPGRRSQFRTRLPHNARLAAAAAALG